MFVFGRFPAGYQDEDLKSRLLEFAKASASPGWKHGPPRPSVHLYPGSFLPQHENPKIDKGVAKIQNCSKEELRDSWGGMNMENMRSMRKKLNSGQVRRNISAGKDSHSAIKSKEQKTAATWFRNSLLVGARVGFLVAKTKQSNIPNQGAAGPATATIRPTSASSSSRPVPTTPPYAETKSKAAARPPARPVAPAASSTPLPKFIAAPPPTYASGSAPTPKARPRPPRPVTLHTYSVGVNYLLEGLLSTFIYL